MAISLIPGSLEKLREAFLEYEPEFRSFDDPGLKFINDERNYKVDLLNLFRKNVLPHLRGSAGEAAAVPAALAKTLSSKLPSINAPQNMLHQWSRSFFQHMKDEYAAKVGAIFQALVDEKVDLEERLQTFAAALPPVVDEAWPAVTQKRSWHSILLILATFILGYTWPERYCFWRVELANFISEKLLGRKICTEATKGQITFAQECLILFELAAAAREGLADWQPRDFIDIQSFFWVAWCRSNAPAETHQESEPASRAISMPPVALSLDDIAAELAKAGLRISLKTLRRYHCALKSRKFVILAGISGTGKTWLAETYAEITGARARVVAVAPNWNSDEDLLGFFNPVHREYNLTPVSQFLEAAQREYEDALSAGREPVPYHLILDEMNLARIEHYFARFLSAMERRDRGAQLELGPDKAILLTPNLYFIGTVNMDETTHGFADKVFDRAQLIEMPLEKDALLAHLEKRPYAQIVMQVWDIIRDVAPFAFRTLDDIAAYVDEAGNLGISWQEALDEEIAQKILPRMRSSSPNFGAVLDELLLLLEQGSYELSAAKLRKMGEAFATHGFANYFA